MAKVAAPVVVSIHAPVKGATDLSRSGSASGAVSIHAPVKGATGCSMPTESVIASFNPRAREGRDLISLTHK